MPKKSHKGTDRYNRKVAIRDQVARFLIVCEGEATEVYYFKKFRVPKRIEPVVHGTGYNTIRVIEEAIRLMKQDDYEQVWCVFDRDSFTAHDFNRALTLAQNKGIQVAYSNEAFELWYLLHFHFCNTGMSRHQYGEKLSQYLREPYMKNDRTMYEKLLADQQIAIKHAQKLLETYDSPKPEQDNPSTTVHVLVIELNKHARP